MKKLLTILFISTMFAGNLEVEGGITATGEVQSPTIAALLAQIADLQSQLSALQGGVSQRVIDLTIEGSSTTNLSELFPAYNLEWALINMIGCPVENGCFLEIPNTSNTAVHMLNYNHTASAYHYHSNNNTTSSFYIDNNSNFVVAGFVGTYTIKLLVTAQFPSDSDIQVQNNKQTLIKE